MFELLITLAVAIPFGLWFGAWGMKNLLKKGIHPLIGITIVPIVAATIGYFIPDVLKLLGGM